MPRPRSIRKREYRLADVGKGDPLDSRAQRRARRRLEKKAATRARKASK